MDLGSTNVFLAGMYKSFLFLAPCIIFLEGPPDDQLLTIHWQISWLPAPGARSYASILIQGMLCYCIETYKPFTSVGPTFTRPVQDPLAVLLLDNRLYLVEKDNNVMVKFLYQFFFLFTPIHGSPRLSPTTSISPLPTKGVIFYTFLLLYVLEL